MAGCNVVYQTNCRLDFGHATVWQLLIDRPHAIPGWSVHALQESNRYSDVIMSAMASQITGIAIVCSTVCSGTDPRNHQIPCNWTLWGESTGDWRIPLSKGQSRGKCFHLLTSSCFFTMKAGQLTTHFELIFTRGQIWPSGIVVACVCLSVCPSVCQSRVCPRDNSSPVSARITKFRPEM